MLSIKLIASTSSSALDIKLDDAGTISHGGKQGVEVRPGHCGYALGVHGVCNRGHRNTNDAARGSTRFKIVRSSGVQ